MKTRLYMAGLLSLFFVSCSDFLDENGYNADYNFYNSDEGLEALVASCYQNGRGMFSTSLTPTGIIFQEIGTDLYTFGGDGETDAALYNSTMNPSNELFAGFWTDCYNGIARANLGLQYLNANTTMDEATKRIREGELKFLRAYYYSIVVTHYGDCPIILEPVDEPKFDFVRSPQKDVWERVITDATDAWNLLPWADAEGKVTGDYGRANKGAAGHLLAKAHMFRYCQKWAGSQSDANMNEDRGGTDEDLTKAIEYAGTVCNFGEYAGKGSPHQLAENYSDLWRYDEETGGPTPDDYSGSEVLFSIQFSTDHFYNNQLVTELSTGGNWLHMMFTTQADGLPLVTSNGNGSENVQWGVSGGIGRTLMTGRGWRRTSPTLYLYEDDGLYGPQYYESNKPGKLIDSRLYKSHVWVYYCNTEPNVPWGGVFTNAAGSYDPQADGHAPDEQRYEVGDSAIVFSVENVDKRFSSGTTSEKLALARAMEPYWYIPMQSIKRPGLNERGDRDGMRCTYPSLIKYLDTRRASANDQAGFRDYFCYRLAETYILLAEAYAMKRDYANSAAALNVVRERAAWKEGEPKRFHYYKYDGGDPADFTKSTVEDMKVTSSFLGGMSDDERLVFFLDEYGREMEGELHRFEQLVRNGADFFVEMIKERNELAGPNVKPFHRFRPIPQKHIDRLDPMDPNAQNYGY